MNHTKVQQRKSQNIDFHEHFMNASMHEHPHSMEILSRIFDFLWITWFID